MTSSIQTTPDDQPPVLVPPDPTILVVPSLKPGWQSSEAWITCLTQLIGAAGAIGILNSTQVTLFGSWISKTVAAAFVLVGLVVQAIHYVSSRTRLKEQHLDPKRERLVGFFLVVLGGALALGFPGPALAAPGAVPGLARTQCPG